MFRYVLVALIPEPFNSFLKTVREEFEPGVNAKIPPHISLTYPFWWEGNEKELVQKIKTAGKGLKSFTAVLTSVETFGASAHTRSGLASHLRIAKDNLVIYISVLPPAPFSQFHEKLTLCLKSRARFVTENFPQKRLPKQYIPHLTIAMKGTDKDLVKAKEFCSPILGFSFLLGEISLLKRANNSPRWQTVSNFIL